MGHNCGSTCKRKQEPPLPCATCRLGGGHYHDSAQRGRIPHATAAQVGMAVDMYFDGLSYRRTAENIGTYTGRPTTAASVYNWVHKEAQRANELLRDVKVQAGDEWVADELAVKVGGRQMWLFNVMDADTRFLLAAHLSPTRTYRAAATAMAMARDRAALAPKTIKTDGLASYNQGVRIAFPVHEVKHVVTQGIRATINNNSRRGCKGRSGTATRPYAAWTGAGDGARVPRRPSRPLQLLPSAHGVGGEEAGRGRGRGRALCVVAGRGGDARQGCCGRRNARCYNRLHLTRQTPPLT